jgi:hypothetical protein
LSGTDHLSSPTLILIPMFTQDPMDHLPDRCAVVAVSCPADEDAAGPVVEDMFRVRLEAISLKRHPHPLLHQLLHQLRLMSLPEHDSPTILRQLDCALNLKSYGRR